VDDWSCGVYAKSGIEEKNDDDQGRQIYLLIEVQGSGISVSFDLTSDEFEAFHHSVAPDGIKNVEASLYCLAERVESLEGSYGVSSRKDEKTGCVLWFMIPYVPDSAYCSPRVDRINTLSWKSPQARSLLKVLIICDKYSSLLNIGDCLLESGYYCDYVDNGPDALKMTMDESASGNQYDAVLLDLDMPMSRKFNFVRRLRQSEKAQTENLTPQLVIGISQSLEYGDTSRALNSGVNAFATPPISIDYLYEIINTFRNSSCRQPPGSYNLC
jgi:CheY-like chemotaxis protein